MSDNFEKTAEQAAAFQKIWTQSMSKLMQTAFTFGGDSAPPEVMQQIRSGIFQALAEAWHEFMRSPQFLEGMRQWMENTVTFRTECHRHLRCLAESPFVLLVNLGVG